VDSTPDHDVSGNGTAPAATVDLGASPNVIEQAGQMLVQWPARRGEFFIIRTSLFEAMVADINAGKRLAAALERVKLTITELD
jgi:hypothetical protein